MIRYSKCTVPIGSTEVGSGFAISLGLVSFGRYTCLMAFGLYFFNTLVRTAVKQNETTNTFSLFLKYYICLYTYYVTFFSKSKNC